MTNKLLKGNRDCSYCGSKELSQIESKIIGETWFKCDKCKQINRYRFITRNVSSKGGEEGKIARNFI